MAKIVRFSGGTNKLKDIDAKKLESPEVLVKNRKTGELQKGASLLTEVSRGRRDPITGEIKIAGKFKVDLSFFNKLKEEGVKAA
ncbi:MAG: hypothetical protein FWC61_02435 [Proteobacteria bacterium]|nr:hypothetical protein [Pseudomonadota bacterium]